MNRRYASTRLGIWLHIPEGWFVLGGLMVSVLAIGTKVRGSKPSQDDGF
jgi:hypothetical protein